MDKTVKFRIVIAVFLICWMAVIFAFSAQPAKHSTDVSDGFVTATITVFYPEFDNLTDETQADITDKLTYVIRKTAHFSEYFILGVLASLFSVTFKKYNIIGKGVASAVFCGVYAASDELHQFYVPGRACRLTDVLIDFTGALTAVLLVILVALKKAKKFGKSGDKRCVKKI